MSQPVAPIVPAQVAFDGTTPISTRHGDGYFMRGQGLAESQSVFIEASNLRQRFSALQANQVFVVGETGFGSGLNMLLAARAFIEHAPGSAFLHLQSAELHPLGSADLRRTLAQWPELNDLAQRLLTDYPPAVPGWHRLRLAPNISLTLMFGDATDQWQQADISVDAWFLDGFAPARNPDMWQPPLLKALADRSAPGATLASFTAAGQVRRGLIEAGFEVWREPGFGNKRHRLVGRKPGSNGARHVRTGRVIVAGAGLAGSTAARALAARGWEVAVIDPGEPASGASGNLCGIVYSTPSAHLTAQNRFYQTSLLAAMRWFRELGFPFSPDMGRLAGIAQKPADARMAEKLAGALDSGAWPAELLSRSGNTYQIHAGGYLRPAAWCQHLLDHPAISQVRNRLTGFQPGEQVLATLAGGQQLDADALLLATAASARGLPGLAWLPLRTSRGQVSYIAATTTSRNWSQPLCHAGYLTPALDDLHCVGATFDRQRKNLDLDPGDHDRNLDQLARHLPTHHAELGGSQARIVGGRAALRCESPDRLPLAGALPDPACNPHQVCANIALDLAHGSRGLTHTPLCAELLADQFSDRPASVEPEIRQALAPERFVLRRRRREPAWRP